MATSLGRLGGLMRQLCNNAIVTLAKDSQPIEEIKTYKPISSICLNPNKYFRMRLSYVKEMFIAFANVSFFQDAHLEYDGIRIAYFR